MISSVIELAPAKVNLALHVIGQRNDGYHLLDSLVVFTQAGDRIFITPSERDSFSVEGPFAFALADSEPSSNLALRALNKFRNLHAGNQPVEITLEKNLPVASGIGGGSSDAAATLRGLEKLQNKDTEKQALLNAALSLGADVPMCLSPQSLIARGIGEQIEKVGNLPQLFMVLVNPGVEVSTPAIFRGLQSRQNPPLPPLPMERSFYNLIEWLKITRNDLEAPAVTACPIIGDTLTALEHQNSVISRMSGSGATCFGLFETEAAAVTAAQGIASAQPSWFVKATTTLEPIKNNVAS